MVYLTKYTEFHSPSYIIEVFNNGNYEEIILGNREIKPSWRKCNADTLYDIASLTKVYTAVLVYIAYQENKIDINDYISNIDDRFLNLNNVKVIDLLSHNLEIWTNGYLGSAKSKEEFYNILFSAYVKSNFPTYVDTHYIILSTMLEKIYDKAFDEILKEKIFEKLKLEKTTVNPTGDNIASCNYELLNNEIINDVNLGLIHDFKGRVAKRFGITTGHASIFTTGRELLLFLKSFLDGSLLKEETINFMLEHKDRNKENYEILRNIVSEDNINRMYKHAIRLNPQLKLVKTYNNMGVRYRNSIEELNDVPSNCSENTIVFSGYTGPTFMIDFAKKIIVVVMCNSLHNTRLDRVERKKCTVTILKEICNQIY